MSAHNKNARPLRDRAFCRFQLPIRGILVLRGEGWGLGVFGIFAEEVEEATHAAGGGLCGAAAVGFDLTAALRESLAGLG